MSLYVLDTDILTLFAEGHPEVVRHVGGQDLKDVAITVLTVEEQLSGWYTQVGRQNAPSGWRWPIASWPEARGLSDGYRFSITH